MEKKITIGFHKKLQSTQIQDKHLGETITQIQVHLFHFFLFVVKLIIPNTSSLASINIKKYK